MSAGDNDGESYTFGWGTERWTSASESYSGRTAPGEESDDSGNDSENALNQAYDGAGAETEDDAEFVPELTDNGGSDDDESNSEQKSEQSTDGQQEDEDADDKSD
jgi:hypothetical protein